MKRKYVQLNNRKGSPVHVVESPDSHYTMKTCCGIWTAVFLSTAKTVRNTRVCWNCKRVLGWK